MTNLKEFDCNNYDNIRLSLLNNSELYDTFDIANVQFPLFENIYKKFTKQLITPKELYLIVKGNKPFLSFSNKEINISQLINAIRDGKISNDNAKKNLIPCIVISANVQTAHTFDKLTRPKEQKRGYAISETDAKELLKPFQYNFITQIEIDNIESERLAIDILQKANKIKNCILAFRSSSYIGLRFLLCWNLKNYNHCKDESNNKALYNQFHKQAIEIVSKVFTKQLKSLFPNIVFNVPPPPQNLPQDITQKLPNIIEHKHYLLKTGNLSNDVLAYYNNKPLGLMIEVKTVKEKRRNINFLQHNSVNYLKEFEKIVNDKFLKYLTSINNLSKGTRNNELNEKTYKCFFWFGIKYAENKIELSQIRNFEYNTLDFIRFLYSKDNDYLMFVHTVKKAMQDGLNNGIRKG